jgi:hypothetical protein
MHSACRFASGHVYTWGMSTFGQLGRGGLAAAAATSVRTPGLVCLPGAAGCDDASAAAAATQRSGARGSSASAGGGFVGGRREPPPLGNALVATSVSCGGMHTCCVGAAGELYAWGRADQGQLGLGRNWMRLAPSGGVGESSSAEGPHKDLKGVCWPTRVHAFGAPDDPVVQVRDL